MMPQMIVNRSSATFVSPSSDRFSITVLGSLNIPSYLVIYTKMQNNLNDKEFSCYKLVQISFLTAYYDRKCHVISLLTA